MPLWPATVAALISGTTNGTSASMRQTPLSSTTTQPCSRAAAPMSRLMSSVADMKAMSQPAKMSGRVASTAISMPLNASRLPTERGDAVRRSLAIGKFRCASTSSATAPTAPVAPTMTTLGSAMTVLKTLFGNRRGL